MVGASWFKKQANRSLLIKNKTRSAAREKRGTRKITPANFQWGISGTAHHKLPTGLQAALERIEVLQLLPLISWVPYISADLFAQTTLCRHAS